MRLETLGALAAFAAAVLAVEQRGNASIFGLVLSYALQLTMLTSMTVRLGCSCAGSCLQQTHRPSAECCGERCSSPAALPALAVRV